MIRNADPDVQEVIYRCNKTSEFSREFIPTFSRDWTQQDLASWDVIDDDTIPYMDQCCWRGSGKSSKVMAKIVKSIYYRQFYHFCWIGATQPDAEIWTENIKGEVMENMKLREYFFGNVKLSFRMKIHDDAGKSFSKKAFYLCDPKTGEPFCFVNPKGVNQAIRGRNIRIKGILRRPDFIVPDDIERDDNGQVDSEDYRIKVRKWFYGAVMYCMDTQHKPDKITKRWIRPEGPSGLSWFPPYRMIVSDTMKHEDANIAHLQVDPTFASLTFPKARYDTEENKYYTCVPELFSDEDIREEVTDKARQPGGLLGYAMEMMCVPLPPGEESWTRKMFKYFKDTGRELGWNIQFNPMFVRFIVMDPARSATLSSCPSGIMSVAVNPFDHIICIRKFINERLKHSEKYKACLDLAVEHNAPIIGVETTGGEDDTTQPLIDLANQMNIPIRWEWLSGHDVVTGGRWGTGKEAAKRARGALILPYYEQGQVYHEESLRNSILESQELSFPKCAAWEGTDCAGYIVKMLSRLEMHWVPLKPKDEAEPWEPFPGLNPTNATKKKLRDGSWRMVKV